jgi:hypothetical protein
VTSLTEQYAERVGLRIRWRNVFVEGTSDVAYIELAARLYRQEHSIDLLGNDLAILPAGIGEDGGARALNQRLMTLRNIAETDRDEQNKLRHTFCALYDYDAAGRRALRSASDLDTRLRHGAELFHLRPIMPLRSGAEPGTVRQRFERENTAFQGLDWEIEDLLPPSMLAAFEADHPTHRDLTRDGKHHLVTYARTYATLADMKEIVILIRALRDYQRLRCDHILC